MRIFLLLLPFIFAFSTASAQYTITDENGDPIVDGSTINIELPDADTNSEVDWHLHSSNSNAFRFQVVNTTQPAGAQNLFCVGTSCYPPNAPLSGPMQLDASNEALLIIYYKPKGYSDPAVIDYKIYEDGNESNAITFTLSYSITSSIDEVTKNNSLFAYPNPANNKVSISYKASQASEIILYNIVGERVAKYDVNAGSDKLELDLSHLSAGTYFYSMVSDSQVSETKRLVIKH